MEIQLSEHQKKQKKEITNLCYKDTYVNNCKTIGFRVIHIFLSHNEDANPGQRTLINGVICGV